MEREEGWGADVAEVAVVELSPKLPVLWEDPGLSGMAGFFRTLRAVLFHPREFFGNLGQGSWAEPLAFALIVSSAGLLCALFWNLLALGAAGLQPDAAGLSPALGLGPGALMAMMAGAPLLVLVNLGVGGLCWWGSVALAGAGRDFLPAWRIFCYAQGGMALAFIPLFGMLVAGIWVLVLMYHGVKQVYGFSVWGSLGALAAFLWLQVLLAMALLLGLAGGLAFLGFLLLLG